MPHTAQTIRAKVLHRGIILRDSANTIQIIVRSVRENLGESCVEVKRIVRRHADNRLKLQSGFLQFIHIPILRAQWIMQIIKVTRRLCSRILI